MMQPGAQLGKYRIEREIGQGGMASVYLATDTTLNRVVALKVLDPMLAEDEVAVERFKREAQTAAGLQHPNIVSIYDVAQMGDYYYIAMRYAPGKTLRDIITEEAPMGVGRVVQLLRSVAAALDYAHTRGVVHRDIKPGNIIVNPKNGDVMLTDFGIARANNQSHLTAVGMVMGTADYLSPEQVRGTEATASSDIYALGVVLYEMLTAYTPYHNKGVADVLRAQLNEPVPPLSRFVKSVPPGAQLVVDRALAKNPADRFQTAVGMIEGLAYVAMRQGQGQTVSNAEQPTSLVQSSRPGQPGQPARQQPGQPARQQPPVAQRLPTNRPVQQAAARPPQRNATPPQTPAQRNKAANEAALKRDIGPNRWPLVLVIGFLALALVGLLLVLVFGVPLPNFGSGASQPPAATVTTAVSYSGPFRSNGNLSASFVAKPPRIDGDLGDWAGQSSFAVAKDTPFKNRSTYLWAGPNDSSGVGYAAWDDSNFYFAIAVRDNVVVQNDRGATMYQGDHVELWFDLDLAGDFASATASDDDYQLGFSIGDPAKPRPEAWLWLPAARTSLRDTLKVAGGIGAGGYVLEGSIPWSTLRSYKPERGAVIGFAFNIGDVDDGSIAPHQEKMISTSSLMTYPNPTTFNNLFFK